MQSVDLLKITLDDILAITQQYEILCTLNMCILHNLSVGSQFSCRYFGETYLNFLYIHDKKNIWFFSNYLDFGIFLDFNLCETGLNEMHTQDKSGSNVDVFV